MLAKPHFAGAAVAESLAAIPGDLNGQAGKRRGVEAQASSALVAGKSRSTGYAQGLSPRGHRRATASILSPSPMRRLLQVIWSITVSSMGSAQGGAAGVPAQKAEGSKPEGPCRVPPRAVAARRLVSSSTGQRPCSLARHNASASSLRWRQPPRPSLAVMGMPQQSPSIPCGTATRQPALLRSDCTTSGSDGLPPAGRTLAGAGRQIDHGAILSNVPAGSPWLPPLAAQAARPPAVWATRRVCAGRSRWRTPVHQSCQRLCLPSTFPAMALTEAPRAAGNAGEMIGAPAGDGHEALVLVRAQLR